MMQDAVAKLSGEISLRMRLAVDRALASCLSGGEEVELAYRPMDCTYQIRRVNTARILWEIRLVMQEGPAGLTAEVICERKDGAA